LKFSVWIYFAYILFSLPGYLSTVIALEKIGLEASAYFQVAWLLNGLLNILPYGVGTSMLMNDRGKVMPFLRYMKIIFIIWLFVIPTIIFLYLFSPLIFQFFGREFSLQSSSVLFWLNVSVIPLTIIAITNSLIQLKKKIHYQVFVSCLSAVIWISLIDPMISLYNLDGLAISILVSYTLTAILSLSILFLQSSREPSSLKTESDLP